MTEEEDDIPDKHGKEELRRIRGAGRMAAEVLRKVKRIIRVRLQV